MIIKNFVLKLIALSSFFFFAALTACNNSSSTTTEADTATMQPPAMDTSMQSMQDTSKMDTASTRPIKHPN